MKPPQQLQDLAQRLWLHNITRDFLDSGIVGREGRDAEVMLRTKVELASIDVDALAQSFAESWQKFMRRTAEKRVAVSPAIIGA